MSNPPAASIRRQVCALLVLLGLAYPALARAAAPAVFRAEVPAPAVGENHGAAIAELPSGVLLVCWYCGEHEEDVRVRIVGSRGTKDGASWSAPWTAGGPGDRAIGASAANKSLGNVTLTVTPDG